MTDKELRKLNRAQLLELLIEQTEENERLRLQMSEMEEKLAEREIAIKNAGSIAEASLSINDVFCSAEKAADQYLENIQRVNEECGTILTRAHEMEAEILTRAKEKAVKIVMGAYGMEGYDADQKKAQSAFAAGMDSIFDASFKQLERHNK